MEAAKDPANKSEAERCLRIAATARKEGELKKARRFADKSLRLYSTQQAQGKLVPRLYSFCVCILWEVEWCVCVLGECNSVYS